MVEIRHLENRHDVIFFCWAWSDLDKILQTGTAVDMSFCTTGTEWHVDCGDVWKWKPDVEFQYSGRQSLNCIKNKIKYGEKRLSICRMEFLHPAMWHDHDIHFVSWLHPAMWHVAVESWQWIHQVTAPCNVIRRSGMNDMPLNSPKRNITSI